MSAEPRSVDPPPPPAFEYRFPWSLREHARVEGALVRNRRRSSWGRLLVWGSLPVLLLMVLYWLPDYLRGRPGASGLTFWIAFPLVLLAYTRWGHPWVAARIVQKRLGQPDATVMVAVRETGVASASPKGTITLNWDAIERVVETPHVLLFYIAPSAGLYLPRRAVPLESEWRAIVARVDGHMRDRGGVVREPRRRARALIGACAAALMVLLLAGLVRWLPPAHVVRGDELRSWHLRALREEGLLQPGEEVYYFYSDASWSILSDVNLLTSSGVTSYARDSSGVYHDTVPYEEIRRVELLREPPLSIIEVITTAGDEVILYASPRGDGDQAFVDRLKQEWRARVPVGAAGPE